MLACHVASLFFYPGPLFLDNNKDLVSSLALRKLSPAPIKGNKNLHCRWELKGVLPSFLFFNFRGWFFSGGIGRTPSNVAGSLLVVGMVLI